MGSKFCRTCWRHVTWIRKRITSSYAKRAEERKQVWENATPAKDYAVDKSADTFAQAALHAFKREKEYTDDPNRRAKGLSVAVENIFPEQYGSAPSEMKEIVQKARETFVKKYLWDEEKNRQRIDGVKSLQDAKK